MRQLPNFILRGVLDELEEAREWLNTIQAPEKKEIHDATPVAVTYWIHRAEEIVGEVSTALDRFDVDVDDDTVHPESFRFASLAGENDRAEPVAEPAE